MEYSLVPLASAGALWLFRSEAGKTTRIQQPADVSWSFSNQQPACSSTGNGETSRMGRGGAQTSIDLNESRSYLFRSLGRALGGNIWSLSLRAKKRRETAIMSLQQNIWKEDYNWEIVSTVLQLVSPRAAGRDYFEGKKAQTAISGRDLIGCVRLFFCLFVFLSCDQL